VVKEGTLPERTPLSLTRVDDRAAKRSTPISEHLRDSTSSLESSDEGFNSTQLDFKQSMGAVPGVNVETAQAIEWTLDYGLWP